MLFGPGNIVQTRTLLEGGIVAVGEAFGPQVGGRLGVQLAGFRPQEANSELEVASLVLFKPSIVSSKKKRANPNE